MRFSFSKLLVIAVFHKESAEQYEMRRSNISLERMSTVLEGLNEKRFCTGSRGNRFDQFGLDIPDE